MDECGGSTSACPFCLLGPEQILAENRHAVAIRDRYPLAEGHTLIIPRQHVGSVFDLPAEEVVAIWALVAEVRNNLVQEIAPDAFTIGVNDGPAAGQTVMHAHVHVVPRHCGDVRDPRGGIRWVLPERAPYWESPP
jgi:diadenosine tetraphosphate (Ap4A) HIT family hydrolase